MARTKRHPVRGVLAGLLTGIGAALLLVVLSVIALGTLTPYLCIMGGAVAGLLWALVGPTRRRRSERVAPSDASTKTDKVNKRGKNKTPEPEPLVWTAPPEPDPEHDPSAAGEATS